MRRIVFALLAISSLTFTAFAEQPQTATLTGTITDADKKPISGATVMVFYAGAKKGYSIFCPSCYPDCGKRTATDAAGAFVIKALNPDLWFTLLVVREGYSPTYIKKTDPAAGPVSGSLPARPPISEPSYALLGRVINASGSPIADAVISPEEL